MAVAAKKVKTPRQSLKEVPFTAGVNSIEKPTPPTKSYLPENGVPVCEVTFHKDIRVADHESPSHQLFTAINRGLEMRYLGGILYIRKTFPLGVKPTVEVGIPVTNVARMKFGVASPLSSAR